MRYEHLPADLVTGIEVIDQDHNHLFSLVELFRASKSDRNLDLLKTVVLGLVEYTVYHFKKEEIGFEICGFAGAAGPEREHRHLEAIASQLQKDLNDQPEIFNDEKFREIDRFLVNWLSQHIRKSDMAYLEVFHVSPKAMKAMETFSFAGYLAEGADDNDPLGDILGET
jgi:hemerythrin-like metal-binding protein